MHCTLLLLHDLLKLHHRHSFYHSLFKPAMLDASSLVAMISGLPKSLNADFFAIIRRSASSAIPIGGGKPENLVVFLR